MSRNSYRRMVVTSSRPIPPAPSFPARWPIGRRPQTNRDCRIRSAAELGARPRTEWSNVARTGCGQRLERLGINIFDRLGIETTKYPLKLTPSASAPGNGPNPTADTKNIAQISSDMLRSTLRIPSAVSLTIVGLFKLRAARMPSGSPMIEAITVPQSAMQMVSRVGPHRSSSALQSGGTSARHSGR